MNVMIYNKYKELLMGLNLEVMKTMEGVYNVDEIIDTFTNFYYDKMILDITAIRDYQNTDNLQKLAMNINMENVILLLDNTPETDSKTYLSKLISLGIYNFTKNAEGINYLLVHPHTYKDVVNIHNIQELEAEQIATNNAVNVPSGDGRLKVIGIKNLTSHAGATTLIYMMMKMLVNTRNVAALEVNRVDFLYFNSNNMVSTTTNELLKELMKKQGSDIVFIDLNDYEDIDICTQVYYLIEPSTIMMNKMLRKNRGILETLKNKNVILNKCVLNSTDIATFEYETKLKVFATIPPVDERQSVILPIKNLIDKMGL
ncbi:MAG: hypothetical protein PUA90_02410 [bacterium]|nr:hypothetical protein [bacterium]